MSERPNLALPPPIGVQIWSVHELAKVDFPNRQQTWQSTMVVIAACVLVGGYLYGLDQAFAHLATKLIDLQK